MNRVKDLPPGTFSASAREIADNCDLLIVLGGDGNDDIHRATS